MSRSSGLAWKLCSGPKASAKYLMRGTPFTYSRGGREVFWISSMLPSQGPEWGSPLNNITTLPSVEFLL